MEMRTYSFKTRVWRYEAIGGWYFVTLPEDESDVIKDLHGRGRRGFGSVRVEVTVGGSTWKTSIFPDKKAGAYILPLKAEIRRKEMINDHDLISITVKII